MVKRASVPEAPERPDIPVGVPVALMRGAGERTMDTKHGSNLSYGVHCYVKDKDAGEVVYVGHVNIFWEAVRAQLAQALGDDDEAVVCGRFVQNGRRYELEPIKTKTEDKLIAGVERLLANDHETDAPEDAPF